jgi:alpha-1,4-digalacturonate transport system permease protein
MLFPFFFMVTTAVKSEAQLAQPELLPRGGWHPGNFLIAWGKAPFTQYLINSTIVAVGAAMATVLLSAMGGFALSKHRFRGRTLIFLLILSTLMVPPQVKMIPNFLICARLGLLDTRLGLVIPVLPLGFGIFLMRQFIATIPDELVAAARVDGAGDLRIFLRLILPLCGPAIATLAIFAFMGSWNEFLWPLIILDTPERYTLPLGLLRFSQQFNVEQNHLMAVSLLSLLPILALFLLCQRAFTKGMTGLGLGEGGA